MDIDTVHEVVAGRFRLRRELGRGGMAHVYLADDEKLDRPVALKIVDLRTDIDGRARQRLLSEARRAAALNHPNVVQIHDVGTDDGRAYIVMEYVDGTTLQQLLDTEGRVEPARAVGIVLAICDALAAAHRLGIIHRDIKPSNVLIDADGRVRVTDFGIARANAGDTLTEEQPLGSAPYISPEQLVSSDVDARADLYALGVVLYELLVGEPPFKAATAVATAWQRLQLDPPDPAEHVALPAALVTVVRHALARDREERYADAEEFRAALAVLPSPPGGDTQPLPHLVEPDAAEAPVEPDAATAPVGGARSRRVFSVVAAVLLLSAAVGAGVWFQQAVGGTSVTVPDVRGMSLGEAVESLHQAGLELGEVARARQTEFGGTASLEVIRQDPLPGTSVVRGEPVDVEVASPVGLTAGDEPAEDAAPDGAAPDAGTNGGEAADEDAEGPDGEADPGEGPGFVPPGLGGEPPGEGGGPPGRGRDG